MLLVLVVACTSSGEVDPPGGATAASGRVATAQAGRFELTARLLVSRAFHTATALPALPAGAGGGDSAGSSGGGGVLLIGGIDPLDRPIATVERYDPDSGRFARAGSIDPARSRHSATLLRDGLLLVAGGRGEGGPLASAVLYDPAAERVVATAQLAEAREGHRAVLLDGGRVLLVGGAGAHGPLASAELFDPASGRFEATGAMAVARTDHSATLLADGRVLVAGGNDRQAARSAEVYDPLAGTFTPVEPADTPRAGHAAAVLPDGRVLLAGGTGGPSGFLSSTALFDARDGAFVPGPSLGAGRSGSTATVLGELGDGRVLLIGGGGGALEEAAFVPMAVLYDPGEGGEDAVLLGGSMHNARGGHTATLLPDGSVLVAGGLNIRTVLLPFYQFREFQPVAERWLSAGAP